MASVVSLCAASAVAAVLATTEPRPSGRADPPRDLKVAARELELLVVPPPAPGQGSASRWGIASLTLPAGAAVVLWVFVAARGWTQAAARRKWFAGDPTCPVPRAGNWPGFVPACTWVGLFLVLAVCYHLATGFGVAHLGGRTAALAVTCIAGVSGVSLLVLLGSCWNESLADVGMGLLSLSICTAAVMAVPSEPAVLSARYPLIFNAVLIGLSVVTWLWAWLSCVWHQQLDNGQAWTATGRLIAPAKRLSFFAAVLGLAVACLMTIWPRLGAVSAMDDSLGRIAAGVAGHLLLLWAVLWCARRLRSGIFTGLAVVTVASMLGFIYVRTQPLVTAGF